MTPGRSYSCVDGASTHSAITVVTGRTTVYCRTPSLHLKSRTLREKEERVNISSSHRRMYGATVRALLLLSHGPRRAAAERRQVRLLLLDLQHEHQTGVLVAQEVQQKDQEVVDDVGLVALSARVHVDGQAGVAERQPLHKTGREAVLRARSCDTAPFQSTRACFHSNIM